ncbi:Exosome complex exonuclease RRP44, partial [Brachionus plicatilis]
MSEKNDLLEVTWSDRSASQTLPSLREEDEQIINRPNVKKLPSGRVVGIIKRNWRPYCGMLQVSDLSDAVRHMFIPSEKRIPKIRIETRQSDQLKDQRIVVSIDCWPRDSRYPLGHFVRSLGPIGDKETENQVLLLEHDVPNYPFPQSVLDCLPSLPWTIPQEEKAKRLDLTHLNICSVDPPGCTDIDDALHCIVLPNGNYQCGVHIADVTHFIRPGTSIDAEARRRSTTVYLVDQRIDMVPELLSSNLCSLRDDGPRYAFSVLWEIQPSDAQIVKTEFHKTIILSRASLTYAQAQMKIDDSTASDELTQGLRRLNGIAKILKTGRIRNGALSLASNEIRFNLDSETHDPIDVISKELMETNSMVEEFMLLANVTVAKKIYEVFPQCACLRRHPAPPVSNFDPLVKAAESKNIKIEVESGKQLADSLDKAVDRNNLFFNTMLRMLTTRCMMQALYFCSGLFPQSEFEHYGLAAPIYTHFTSPIRRYADILVHRLLAAAINADTTYPDLLDKHAYVLAVKKNALQVLIPRYGLEGTLYLNDFPFVFNELEPSQSAANVKLQLFDKLVVRISIETKNKQHQKMKFASWKNQTLYEILGVPKTASVKEIKVAYYKKCKECHPDKSQDDKSHDQFVKIQQAYDTLSKADSRRTYDLTLQNYTSTGNRYTRSTPSDAYQAYRTQQTYYYYNGPRTGMNYTESEFERFMRTRNGYWGSNTDPRTGPHSKEDFSSPLKVMIYLILGIGIFEAITVSWIYDRDINHLNEYNYRYSPLNRQALVDFKSKVNNGDILDLEQKLQERKDLENK